MRKIPITGGPHTGKSTLLEALRSSDLEAEYVAEPATEVIREERQRELHEEGYEGKFPWNNYAAFGKLVTAKSLMLESAIPEGTELAILDRSIIDTIGYARLNRCEFLIPKLVPLIGAARYSSAIVCDFVGEYSSSYERSETQEEAQATHIQIVRAYEESGLTIIHLPPVSVEERVSIVSNAIGLL